MVFSILVTAACCGGRSNEAFSNWGKSSPNSARMHASAEAQRDISSYLRGRERGGERWGGEGGGRGGEGMEEEGWEGKGKIKCPHRTPARFSCQEDRDANLIGNEVVVSS